MPAPISLVDLSPDFFCSPSRSQWLREYRLALHWTQAQLADACGVSRSRPCFPINQITPTNLSLLIKDGLTKISP